jgi:hypothetical protein
MQATLQKDKIFLDVTDSPELAELFSRKETGDKIKGRFEATMDDKSNGTITMSIDDIRLEAGKGNKVRGEDAVEDDKDDEPTSVRAMKAAEGDMGGMMEAAPMGPAENPEKEGAIS